MKEHPTYAQLKDNLRQLEILNHQLGEENACLKRAELTNYTLFRITNTINTTANLKELYASIHETLGAVIDTTNFYIALYHKVTNSISFPYFRDEMDEDYNYIRDFTATNSLTGEVILSRAPLFLTQEMLLERAQKKQILGTVPKIWLGVPLLIKAEVVGVMAVQNYFDDERFKKDDLDLLIAVAGQIATVIDRKRITDAIRESEERFRALVESSPQIVFLAQDGRFIYGNPAGVNALGYNNKEDIKGLEAIQPIAPEFREIVIQRMKDIENDIINPPIEIRMTNRKGIPLWILSSSVAVRLNGKKTVIIVGQDITEKKKMENELIQSHKMEAIGALAGGIAHDFNNDLSSIIGFTELAIEDAKPGTMQEDNLQEVYKAGLRAKELVSQILSFARQTDEPTEPIQIDSIAQEVAKFIRSSIPSTIEIKPYINSKSQIIGNSTQIRQIILNLCTNAAQAMDESGGILEISIKDVMIDKASGTLKDGLKQGDYIKIKVSDTGVGIPSSVIGSIFQPYFTTKAIGEGTGMGLAVVQGIVEKCGGTISVESTEGKGSAFSVYLPITKKRKCKRVYEPYELPSGTERILFIDDEVCLAKMGSQNLQSLGYSVATRTNSLEALELFRSEPEYFDLIVTDMTMPNMTGEKLAIELMKIRPEIPIILCTGYSNKISNESATDLGVKAFAYKPIVKEDLAKTVRKVLDEAQKLS